MKNNEHIVIYRNGKELDAYNTFIHLGVGLYRLRWYSMYVDREDIEDEIPNTIKCDDDSFSDIFMEAEEKLKKEVYADLQLAITEQDEKHSWRQETEDDIEKYII